MFPVLAHTTESFTVFIRIEVPSRIEAPPDFGKEIICFQCDIYWHLHFVTCCQNFVWKFLGDINIPECLMTRTCRLIQVLFMCRFIITVCSTNKKLNFDFLKGGTPSNLFGLGTGASTQIKTVCIFMLASKKCGSVCCFLQYQHKRIKRLNLRLTILGGLLYLGNLKGHDPHNLLP